LRHNIVNLFPSEHLGIGSNQSNPANLCISTIYNISLKNAHKRKINSKSYPKANTDPNPNRTLTVKLKN